MMKAKYNSAGDRVPYTPTGSALDAGDVVVQQSLIGVVLEPIAQNAQGTIAVSGVFEVAKATGTGTGIAAGKVVYWKASPGQATESSTGNTLMGKTVKIAADDDATVLVRLG